MSSDPAAAQGTPDATEGTTPAVSRGQKWRRPVALGVVCGLVGFVLSLFIFRWPGHLPPNWGDIPNWFLVVLAAGGGWFTLSQLVVQKDALDDQKKNFAAQLAAQKQQAADEKQALEAQLALQGQQLTDQNKAFEQQLAIQQQQLDGQRAAFQRDSDDRRKAQAKLVFFYTELTADTILSQAQRIAMGAALRDSQVVHVKNTSRQPVYDIEVNYYDGPRFHNTLSGGGVMMPDSEVQVTEELRGGVSRYRVTMSFRDAAGVRWLLDEAGNMDQVLVLRAASADAVPSKRVKLPGPGSGDQDLSSKFLA